MIPSPIITRSPTRRFITSPTLSSVCKRPAVRFLRPAGESIPDLTPILLAWPPRRARYTVIDRTALRGVATSAAVFAHLVFFGHHRRNLG